MTPHQAFTRRKPTLDDLLMFGCTVTPKMAKDRTSALDPNSHHGILLGCIPNNDVRHWDIHTQSEKTAGHGKCDELQCGDNPTQRSPASEHLLNVMTGADHAERRTDVMHKKAVEVSSEPNSSPIDTTQTSLCCQWSTSLAIYTLDPVDTEICAFAHLCISRKSVRGKEHVLSRANALGVS
jgi:hypothetical protein